MSEPIKEPLICDGCNVRGLHEHRCHGFHAWVRGEPTNKSCECPSCTPSFTQRVVDERDALKHSLRDAVKDKQRLDWLDRNPTPDLSQVGNDQGWTIRQAIDSAMLAEREKVK